MSTYKQILDKILKDERVEGMEEIRKAIDPHLSHMTFYRKWRPIVDPILMENTDWRTNPERRGRYFTFRRYILAILLREQKPKVDPIALQRMKAGIKKQKAMWRQKCQKN